MKDYSDYSISDFLKMQLTLAQEKGWMKDRTPDYAPLSLLWSIDEMGEAIAIIKKKGADGIMNNENVRAHFVEEIADTFMYIFDMMTAYGIDGEEFTKAFVQKYEHNLGRSWSENDAMYDKSLFRRVYFDEKHLPDERLGELIVRAGTGFYVVSDHPEEVREALNTLINDSAKAVIVSAFPETSDADVFCVRNADDLAELSKKYGVS